MSSPVTVGAIVLVTVITGVIGARGVRVARTPADFLVAARSVPPLLNASAISGEYLSAASFLGVAGLAMLDGLGALWYAVGYAGGYLVLLATIAAPLRRFGTYTIPEFAEGRLESARLAAGDHGYGPRDLRVLPAPPAKGAGITLQAALGGPYWVGVVALGTVVTIGIASGGMKGITIVQAFQFWLKLTAIAVPALFLLIYFHHPAFSSLRGEAPPTFATATTVKFPDPEQVDVQSPVTVEAYGVVDGEYRHGPLLLAAGGTSVGAGSSLRFPAGAKAPTLTSTVLLNASEWESPLVRINGIADHPLAATYGVVLATFLGALGSASHTRALLHQPRWRRRPQDNGRRAFVLGLFLCLPGHFRGARKARCTPALRDGPDGLGRPGTTPACSGWRPRGGPGRTYRRRGLRRIPVYLVGLADQHVRGALARPHGQGGAGVPDLRSASGLVATACGLVVAGDAINVLVGWAFAIAASSLCPLLLLGIWWPGLTWKGALAGLVLGGGAASFAVLATMLGAGKSGWPAVLLGEPAILAVPLAFLTMVGVSKLTRSSLPPNVTAKSLALHLPEAVRPT